MQHCVNAGSVWKKLTNKFCSDWINTYHSLDAAKTACLQNKLACRGVYDDQCNGSGTFYTCKAHKELKTSNSHSCVYTIAGTITSKKCTCQNGTPAAGDR